jgi:hypothetical protein
VFFFDTLLHQVDPNWDAVLQMYAGIARIVLIYNPQYVNLQTTTRLLDLGLDEYARNVPLPITEERTKHIFATSTPSILNASDPTEIFPHLAVGYHR